MSSNESDVVCSVCGRGFGSFEEVERHMREAHGGQSGRGAGGPAGVGSDAGSGPTGTTTSGSRGTDTAPDAVHDDDDPPQR